MPFMYRIVEEENFLSSNIWQSLHGKINIKIITLEKLFTKSAQMPPLKRPIPLLYFHHLFKIYQIPPSEGGK